MYERTITATATITNKSENQDCVGEFDGKFFNAIFVADGLGSFVHPKLTSEKVTDFFLKHSEKINQLDDTTKFHIDFVELFKEAKQEIINFSKEFLKENEIKSDSLLGTTLLAVYETEQKIIIA